MNQVVDGWNNHGTAALLMAHKFTTKPTKSAEEHGRLRLEASNQQASSQSVFCTCGTQTSRVHSRPPCSTCSPCSNCSTPAPPRPPSSTCSARPAATPSTSSAPATASTCLARPAATTSTSSAPTTAHSWTLSGQTTFFIPTNKQSTIIFTLSQK